MNNSTCCLFILGIGGAGATTSGFGAFGQKPAGGLFGASSTATTGGGLFGNTNTNSGLGGFGTTTSTASGGLFGAKVSEEAERWVGGDNGGGGEGLLSV